MEKTLFLLGLIRNSDLYGYQINELMDAHFDLIVRITRPTAYRLLNKMTLKGWIEAREEQPGNRPPRKIYTLTQEGEKAFQRILRQSLADYSPSESSGAVGMAFIQEIPPDELRELLEKRREKIQGLLMKLAESETHQGNLLPAFEYRQRSFETDLVITTEILEGLRTG